MAHKRLNYDDLPLEKVYPMNDKKFLDGTNLKDKNYLGRCFRYWNNKKIFVYRFKCNNECENILNIQYSNCKTTLGICNSCQKRGKPFEFVYNELKKSEHKSGKKEVHLTYEEFLIFTKIKECHYCNSAIIWNPCSNYKGKIFSRSYKLDRKINEKSYSLENCVVCCWNCNRSKSNIFSYEEFFAMTRTLRETRGRVRARNEQANLDFMALNDLSFND